MPVGERLRAGHGRPRGLRRGSAAPGGAGGGGHGGATGLADHRRQHGARGEPGRGAGGGGAGRDDLRDRRRADAGPGARGGGGARGSGAGAVVAVGGGSALDGGKAIAALAANDGDALDYLEVVGAGKPLARTPLPFFAVPTTEGTGSEVTRNAVLTVPGARVKASLRSPLMLPRLAAVDPELLDALPPAVVASSGLDALSQVIEPFLSVRANPLTDALARDGIGRSARAL